MQKTAKVVKKTAEEWSKKPNDPKMIHTIEMDNGDKGWHSSTDDGAHFTEGVTVIYEIRTTPKKDGSGFHTWIDKPREAKSFGGGGRPMSKEDIKFKAKIDVIGYGTSYAKDMAVAGIIKLEEGELSKYAGIFINFMQKQIDAVE